MWFKKTIVLILILAIAIPLKYRSTDPKYLIVRCLHSIFTIKHWFVQSELSAEYRAFESLFRLKPIPKPDPSIDPLPLIKTIRPRFLLGTLIPKPSQCQIRNETIEHNGHTVETYWVHHHSQQKIDRIVFYLHGGGFIMGDIHGYSGIECYLSELLNMPIIHIEYRLSPEHHLPAAVDDALAVYQFLIRNNIKSSQIIIMGDSAGGGLALLTVQKLISQQLPTPRAIVCLSPITDFTMTSESYQRNARVDVMLSYDYVKWIVRQAIGVQQQSQIGPLFESLSHFPPMYISVGTAEVMEDDSRKLVDKARAEGVDVTFDVGLHMMHGYPAFVLYFPEAREAMTKIALWIRNV